MLSVDFVVLKTSCVLPMSCVKSDYTILLWSECVLFPLKYIDAHS